jgi:prolyl oligopeptidase PreP (S9A serine peptidase family)
VLSWEEEDHLLTTIVDETLRGGARFGESSTRACSLREVRERVLEDLEASLSHVASSSLT